MRVEIKNYSKRKINCYCITIYKIKIIIMLTDYWIINITYSYGLDKNKVIKLLKKIIGSTIS